MIDLVKLNRETGFMLANDMQITVRYGGICICFGHVSGTISSDSEPFF